MERPFRELILILFLLLALAVGCDSVFLRNEAHRNDTSDENQKTIEDNQNTSKFDQNSYKDDQEASNKNRNSTNDTSEDSKEDTKENQAQTSGIFPHIPPSGANLILNPSITSADTSDTSKIIDWTLSEGAVFDTTISHDDGSGSLRLSKKSDAVTSDMSEPLEAGQQYIASCYIRSDQFPSA
ncbi:MAG: hypothetical protein PVI90_20270, partial [Desulfobacteraceae bacterium]